MMREPDDPELVVVEPCPFSIPAGGWLLVGGILFIASIVLLQGGL